MGPNCRPDGDAPARVAAGANSDCAWFLIALDWHQLAPFTMAGYHLERKTLLLASVTSLHSSGGFMALDLE